MGRVEGAYVKDSLMQHEGSDATQETVSRVQNICWSAAHSDTVQSSYARFSGTVVPGVLEASAQIASVRAIDEV
jgi:hypothetical protein